MSSRALRRLQQEAAVIKVSGGLESSSGDEEKPGFSSSKSKKNNTSSNPFGALVADADDEDSRAASEDNLEESHDSHMIDGEGAKDANQPKHSTKKKKKKRKRAHQQQQEPHPKEEEASQTDGLEEVDAALKEVNALLGDPGTSAAASSGATATTAPRPLLSVDKRFLHADNEMKRIFGSRVVRAEGGGRHPPHHHHHHQRRHLHKHSLFVSTKDTWPKMDKPGLTMELAESKDGCQYFCFNHSTDYQKVQFQFLEAVGTFDPEAIAVVLRAHPYHIDSLLQLSEVCKMSEDLQMATELVERALYCFECNFHILFNMAHGNCRLNYSVAENRPFYITLFRHLFYAGRKGCHRTALELCKLLLSLDPEGDPLCTLLMIDYYALRSDQHDYLLSLYQQWEKSRNLSQLPNFAFSIPLARYYTATEVSKHAECRGQSEEACLLQSDQELQEALIMFPNLLIPLMDKCGVTLDPIVTNHAYFTGWNLNRDPSALQLLFKLFIERNHSLWKIPEVLTWLEKNAREVIKRVDAKDPRVADSAEKRERRYVGTPRNICRHVIMSDYEQVTATLPRNISESGIMMHDPLPPPDSTSGYTIPPRQHSASMGSANPLLLFLRSLLPTFQAIAENPAGMPGANNQLYGARLNRAHLVAAQQARDAVVQHQAAAEGAGGTEGHVASPLDLQGPLNELVGMLQRVLDFLPGEGSDGYDSTDSNDR